MHGFKEGKRKLLCDVRSFLYVFCTGEFCSGRLLPIYTFILRRFEAVCMGLKKENEDCCAMSDHFYMYFVQVSFVLGDYYQFIPCCFRKYTR